MEKINSKLSLFIIFWLTTTYASLAQLASTNNSIEKIKEYLHLSEQKEQEGDLRTASDFLNKAAMIESEAKNYANAALYYEKSLTLNEKIKNQTGVAGINSNLAMLYYEMEQYEKALELFQKTLTIRKQRNEKEGVFDAMFNIGMIQRKLNRVDEAIKSFEEALSFAQEKYDLIKMRLCYGTLYEVYQQKNDVPKMSYYYSFYNDFNNRIFNKANKAVTTAENKARESENKARESEIEARIAILEKLEKEKEVQVKEKEIKQKDVELAQISQDKKILFGKLSEEQKMNLLLEQDKRILAQQNELKEAEIHKEKLEKEHAEREARHTYTLLLYGSIAFVITIGLLVLTFAINLARKKANRELKQKQIDLSQANKVKDKMFSIIAHDLRAPFNGIKGLLVLLERDLLDEQEKSEMLGQLRVTADSTLETLENLLRWANGQIKGLKPNPISLDLNTIAENSLNLLNETARQKDIIVTNLLPLYSRVVADADHLDIIIRNIVSNAIKFTNKGGWVSINATEEEGTWKVSVRDSGVGIPADKLANLFDSEKNHSTRGTNNEKGTGLGLVLVKELIEKNGGVLSVESKLREGTTFSFTLPAGVKEKVYA